MSQYWERAGYVLVNLLLLGAGIMLCQLATN